MTTDKALIICVNYKTDDDTKKYVNNLLGLEHAAQLKICIANNSADSSTDESFRDLKNVDVVNLPENLGYFGAAQKVFEVYKDQIENYNYVVISNTDIEVEDHGFFGKLFNEPISPDIGLIAPSILSSLSRKDMNPYFIERPKASRMHFYKRVFSNYITCQIYQLMGLLKSFFKSQHDVEKTYPPDQLMYAAHGSFLCFTKYYFRAGCNFSHGVFLYGEEITVAENCRRNGLKIIYKPELKIIHREHGSTGFFYSQKTISFFKESSKYLANTYFR